MIIIGLVGKKEAGKTTFAKFIQDHCPENMKCIILSFASILKTMLFTADICTEDELYFHKNQHSREMMQKIGTNVIRDQIDKDFFCKSMAKKIREVWKGIPPFNKDIIIIIDDVRFKNEANLIKNINGSLINIVRPKSEEITDLHRSETEMDQIKNEITIFNDSGLDNLEKAAKSLIDFIPVFKNTTRSEIALINFD